MIDKHIDDVFANPDSEDAVRTLHALLFPEEYDFIYDSGADLYDRKSGKNPMNAAYIKTVDDRRTELGFELLGNDGYAEDQQTMEFVKAAVATKDIASLQRVFAAIAKPTARF